LAQGAQSTLRSPQPPPTQTILTSLINEIAAISDEIILVLDDYHLIESSSVDNILNFLLEHLPTTLHLVIATREDPRLPLSRLRARGQLTELRAADLRFTTSEAAVFLHRVMGLDLSTEDITALERRTEGWIAGLQLAAISMRGQDDAAKRIKSFTGSHRLVLDYLIEEVLEQQPETVQTFLLQTAILDRFNSSLCDAVRFGITETVVEQDSSQEILEMLERSNLFIIPLDEDRCWYRYHHLFADLLLQKLNQTQAGLESELHNRASKWYEQNRLMEEAVDHALAAKEFERAVNLIEGQIDAIWERGEHAKILEWLNSIPPQKLSVRPLISIYHTYVQLEDGKVEAAEKSLKAVEQAILLMNGKTSPDDPQIGQLNAANLKSKAAVMRAMIAFRKADVPSILKFSREALEDLPEKELSWRGIAAMALGDAQYIVGDMKAANKALSEAIRISKTAGNIYIVAYTSIKLAIILQYQGKLDQALEICRELLTLMNTSGLGQSALMGVLNAQWADILLDLNDIDQAFQFVSRGIELSKHEIDLTNLAWSRIVLVKVLYAKRDLNGAMKNILQLDKIARASYLPPWIVNRIAAWKARIWLNQGNLSAVNQWVQERQLKVDDELLFVREVEYIVLARILILQGDSENAVDLLERLIVKAEAGDRITRLIEMLLVLALALKAHGDNEKAMMTLSKGLSLAEDGGHTRLFVNEGPPMTNLLNEASSRGIRPDYVRHLLSEFPVGESEKAGLSKTHALNQELVEPLSEREIEVLQLIAEGLTNTEIAARLYLSLNTVKVHTRNIYGKLGVNNRTQAVARGRAVGILPSI